MGWVGDFLRHRGWRRGGGRGPGDTRRGDPRCDPSRGLMVGFARGFSLVPTLGGVDQIRFGGSRLAVLYREGPLGRLPIEVL